MLCLGRDILEFIIAVNSVKVVSAVGLGDGFADIGDHGARYAAPTSANQ